MTVFCADRGPARRLDTAPDELGVLRSEGAEAAAGARDRRRVPHRGVVRQRAAAAGSRREGGTGSRPLVTDTRGQLTRPAVERDGNPPDRRTDRHAEKDTYRRHATGYQKVPQTKDATVTVQNTPVTGGSAPHRHTRRLPGSVM